jgi:hypothetical protein
VTPCPKPAKPARDRAYMGYVAQLGCVCCGRDGVQVHHPIMGRYAQRRAADDETIPLCFDHHQLLHNEPAAWRITYGLDTDFIARTREAVERLRANTIGGRN